MELRSSDISEGADIICIDNTDVEKLLVLYKKYRCVGVRIDAIWSDLYVSIEVYGNVPSEFFAGRFITLKSFREGKLDHIIL